MAIDEEIIGTRRLPVLIDKIARETPDKPYVVIPVDDEDLSKGFREINFKQFANGINRAVGWLSDNIPKGGAELETLAYAGPKDLRYSILAVACLKLRKKILLCSPYATPAAQRYLLKLSETTTYLHSESLGPAVASVLEELPDIKQIQAPEADDWVFGDQVPEVPFERTWEQCSDEPWVLVHTSGTTGLPKLLPHTLRMMSAFDTIKTAPEYESGKPSGPGALSGRRLFVAIPNMHVVGITSLLQWPAFLGTVIVMGTLSQPTPQQTIDTIKYSGAVAAIMPPALIDGILKTPSGLETLITLKGGVYFAGAPLPPSVAKQLVPHMHVGPAIGSTEVGAYWLTSRFGEPDAWEYLQFQDVNGFEFEDRGAGLYELVVRRRADLAAFQQIFLMYPDLAEYATRDLWSPHPDPAKPGLWKFAGRADDMVKLVHGESLLATAVEDIVGRAPHVKAVMVAGDWKPTPCLIVDRGDKAKARGQLTEQERQAGIEQLWPYVQQANAILNDVVKIPRQNVIFTDRDRPLPVTAKGGVQRRVANQLYKDDVDRLYPEEP